MNRLTWQALQTVGPSGGLIVLQFDLRILDEPTEVNIPNGYMNISFSEIPEPSQAPLVLGLVAALLARAAGNPRQALLDFTTLRTRITEQNLSFFLNFIGL